MSTHQEQLDLVVPSRSAAIPLITAFVREATLLLGGTSSEAASLELASEEAALYIVERMPRESSADEAIATTCRLDSGRMHISFRNQGLPVDLKHLPGYSPESPEESLTGLGLHLMRQLVDEVRFFNHGKDGWETSLVKKLSRAGQKPASDPLTSATDEKAKRHSDTVQYTVHRLHPTESYDLSKLTYLTYRYSYSKEEFYYPEQLEEMVASGELVAFVATLDSGEMIGHMGLRIIPSSGGTLAESGLVMVDPSFRRSHCMTRLGQAMAEYLFETDLEALVGWFVTTHTHSQKGGLASGVKPTGFRLSLHEQADFKGVEGKPQQRESLLSGVFVIRPLPPLAIYPPVRHTAIIERTFAHAGVETNTSAAPGAEPPPGNDEARVEVVRRHDIQTAFIRPAGSGRELARQIHEARIQLCKERFETLYLFLDLHDPRAPLIAEDIERFGFFFSGIEPTTSRKWEVLYTYLNNQELDRNLIHLADPFSEELLDYILQDENEATRRV